VQQQQQTDYVPPHVTFCSDNHALLAQRNISQEQALDYFHGIAAIMFLRIFIWL
jgi:hypothetical protein